MSIPVTRPCGPDSGPHQPHDGTWAAPNVEATHAGLEADTVERLLGHGLLHHRPIAQTLIFPVVARMHVAVLGLLLRS
jgi:hypothetical protein